MDHVDAAVGQAGPRMSGLLTSLAEQGSGMVGRAFERAQRIQAVAAGAAASLSRLRKALLAAGMSEDHQLLREMGEVEALVRWLGGTENSMGKPKE